MIERADKCYWYGCGALVGAFRYEGWPMAIAHGVGLAICLALVLWANEKLSAWATKRMPARFRRNHA